jgi:hypothetical protein
VSSSSDSDDQTDDAELSKPIEVIEIEMLEEELLEDEEGKQAGRGDFDQEIDTMDEGQLDPNDFKPNLKMNSNLKMHRSIKNDTNSIDHSDQRDTIIDKDILLQQPLQNKVAEDIEKNGTMLLNKIQRAEISEKPNNASLTPAITN